MRRTLLAWYRREARDLPWRRTRDPYAIWVSEIMLQQTTVEAVLPYYGRFLARYPDLPSLAGSREDDLLAIWSGLGYYRRARNMRAAARLVIERHGGRFPERLDEIRALPGIGRYTAGAIASISFAARAAVVDGNVARVLSRLYALEPRQDSSVRGRVGARGGPVTTVSYGPQAGGTSRPASRESELWRIAEELVPAMGASEWNQALMELGARICRPASPACSVCPVGAECLAFASGDPARFSSAKKRPAAIDVRASLVAIARRGRVLLVRRSGAELLGGLWELPGTLAEALHERAVPQDPEHGDEHLRAERLRRRLQIDLGFEPTGLEPCGSVVHTVTHRRLTIEAWRAAAPVQLPPRLARSRGEAHIWIRPDELDQVPIGAATKKVLRRVLSSADPT